MTSTSVPSELAASSSPADKAVLVAESATPEANASVSTPATYRAQLSPIALSESDGADLASSHRRKSSASSENGLYEPIGEPRSVCTLERVVQILNQKSPTQGNMSGTPCHDNVYTAIDDDVCSFYSFQSTHSSATNPSGRGSRQPTAGGTMTSNIYDPVSLEIAGGNDQASRPSSTSHWNTLEMKRENFRNEGNSPSRRIVSSSENGKASNGNTASQLESSGPPRRPTRPGMVRDPQSPLDAISENQTVASPQYHSTAAAASTPDSAAAGSYSNPYSSSQFHRQRSPTKPLKDVARAKVMAAIHAPSTKRITNLFARFPRRSKSLDPSFAMRVSGEGDLGSDPITSTANARVRGSDACIDRYGSRGSKRAKKSIFKQKSVDDTLLASPSASASTAKEAKEKKLSLRLMEMLKIDKWHHRNFSAPKSRSDINVNFHSSFPVSSFASPQMNGDEDDLVRPRVNPLVRDFGSQGRLVATGSGETFVAHLEREIQSKQIVVPATPSEKQNLSSYGASTPLSQTLMEFHKHSIVSSTTLSKVMTVETSTPYGSSPSSTLLSGEGRKTMRVVSPKERPKVPPPKTPTVVTSLTCFDISIERANEMQTSSSSNVSSSSPTVPSNKSNATKPIVPKKPQINLLAQPTPPPRNVNRGPRSTSTGSSVTSGSSINSEAKNPLPPSSIYDTEVKTTDKNIFTDVPCEDYLEPITGGSLYSISEPLFTPSKTHKISFTNHNNNHHLKPTTPHSTPNTGTFNGDDNDIQIPKPFPRRKSLKKNLKDKKRSLSEEKESIEVFKESKKTSSSVDVLQSTSADNHIALNLVSESSLLFNGNSSHRTVHESSMSSQYRHHYVTLSPEYEFTYEESRVATRRFVNDTLDLVLTKAKQFLRVRNRHLMNESCADDWDILSHIPLTFEGLSGHRFEIFAASLKSDPVEAFSLMVLPEELDFELDSILNFSRCGHNDSPPSVYGDFFLPVIGSFIIIESEDDFEDQCEAFFRDFIGRWVLICPIALENLQTLDSFLTEKTLQDLASDDSTEQMANSTRSSVLLQLFQQAQSFAQHFHCPSEDATSEKNSAIFTVANIDSFLVYTPSSGENGCSKSSRPTLLLNPCDFFRPEVGDHRLRVCDEANAISAALSRWTSLILGDVLHSSFASVESFMRGSDHCQRNKRLDLRLCDAITQIRNEAKSVDAFVMKVTQLLELITRENLQRAVLARSEDEECFGRRFARFCCVEEAKTTGDLIRLLFQCMEKGCGGGSLGLDFEARGALASTTRNAQWLIQRRQDDFDDDPSIYEIFIQLITK